MKKGTVVKVDIPPVNELIKRLGFHKDGDVQKELTKIVNERIEWYMPSSATGVLSTKKKFIKSATEIEVLGPYARYQYFGKVMVNEKTGKGPANIPGVGLRYKEGTVLKETDRPLEYNKTYHAQAGPRWDKALVAAEGKAIEADLQRYIDRRNKS